MRKINFIKMAGAGNDFIMIDAHKGLNYKSLAKKMCDRTNGIGRRYAARSAGYPGVGVRGCCRNGGPRSGSAAVPPSDEFCRSWH